jgi:hypothetical protein
MGYERVRSEKEEKLRNNSEIRMQELVIQKEILNQNRHQKRRIVERIMRANDY